MHSPPSASYTHLTMFGSWWDLGEGAQEKNTAKPLITIIPSVRLKQPWLGYIFRFGAGMVNWLISFARGPEIAVIFFTFQNCRNVASIITDFFPPGVC